MRIRIAALALAATLLTAARADAQVFASYGSARPVGSIVPYDPAYGFGPGAVAPTYPYSYWVNAPAPSREYVGWGSNDFGFAGVPYGHRYDRWSWEYMSGNGSLSRYFYPPVR